LTPFSRAAFWSNEQEAIEAVKDVLQAKRADDSFVLSAFYFSSLGILRAGLNPASVMFVLIFQLSLATLSDAKAGLPDLVATARQLFSEHQLGDPFPACVKGLLTLPSENETSRARQFARLIENLSEKDRRYAMAQLVLDS
jgi:hypothetical protein